VRTDELAGVTVECLEGCGFCCTFPPEVARDELARLRARFPALPTVRQSGTVRLALQGGCGACTLLARRACSAYEDRPAHCRYFPFHVYFGRRTEVYVDVSCRGVAGGAAFALAPSTHATAGARPGSEALRRQVLDVAPAGAIAAHEAQAKGVHADFESKARAAGAWGDVDAAIQAAVAAEAFAAAPSPERWAAALRPFAASKVVQRPFYLDQALRWLTFQRDGGRLEVLEMQEDGSLTLEGTEVRPEARAPPPAAREGLRQVLARLASRDVMAGQAFDLVDASGYRLGVEKAARERVAQVAADLTVRVQVLQALGVPGAELAAEAWRFYDAAFLDQPTVGGWL
jgi:Fe-S-cluster containining protein